MNSRNFSLDRQKALDFGKDPVSSKSLNPAASQDTKNNLTSLPSVLIAEDERLVAENLRLLLEDNGYRVTSIVASGEEAIRLMQASPADLILMDVRLKGHLDGVETALILQKTHRNLPIVFVTAYSKDDFPHLTELNPSLYGYVSKPYLDTDLLATIQQMLKRTSNS